MRNRHQLNRRIAAHASPCATAMAAALLAGLLLPVAAHAQSADATPAAAPARDTGIGEIVVTAQKRATSADKTPISITAVTGAEIAGRGITSFADLAAGTPGVSIKAMGPGQTEFEMRGMTSSGGNSPTVGFYLDDIPLTAPAAAQNGKVVIDPTLYDLGQVEVLRGPQGTLYGSSSMGGTVKLITNKPKLDKWEESLELVGSGTDNAGFNHAENAMVNVPLGHTLALRAVVSQSNDAGWIDRVVVGNFPVATSSGINPGASDVRGNVLAAPVLGYDKHSNSENKIGTRVTLLWKPTENLTVTPSFFYQRTHQDGPSTYDSAPGTMAHYQPFNVAEPYSDNIKIGSLSINYRFPAFDVTSSTSYWSRKSTMIQDNSENLPSVGGGFGVTTDSASYYGPAGTGPIYVSETDPSKQFSQELRAASTGNGPIKWLIGGYYASFRSSWLLSENVSNPAAFGSPTNQIFTVIQPTKIDQEAAFGELTWSPTKQLHITGGVRVYHYASTLDTSSAGFGEPSGTAAPVTLHVVEKNTGANPKLDISYQITPDALVYVTAAKGFRPGGGNQPLPSLAVLPANPTAAQNFANSMYQALVNLGYANGQAPVSYSPDHLWSYEAGEKIKLFDRHLRLNSSVYYEDWAKIQLEQLPLGYPLFDNVDNAHIYGGESEIQALLGEVTLGGSIGYTHATLANTQHNFTKGQRLPDVPYWSGGANITYTHDLDDMRQATVRVDETYVGARVGLATYQGIVNNSNAPLPGYNLFNARATIKSKAGWSIALFINNITDKHAYLENVAQLGLPNASYNRVVTNQPRTVGLDLSLHM